MDELRSLPSAPINSPLSSPVKQQKHDSEKEAVKEIPKEQKHALFVDEKGDEDNTPTTPKSESTKPVAKPTRSAMDAVHAKLAEKKLAEKALSEKMKSEKEKKNADVKRAAEEMMKKISEREEKKEKK